MPQRAQPAEEAVTAAPVTGMAQTSLCAVKVAAVGAGTMADAGEAAYVRVVVKAAALAASAAAQPVQPPLLPAPQLLPLLPVQAQQLPVVLQRVQQQPAAEDVAAVPATGTAQITQCAVSPAAAGAGMMVDVNEAVSARVPVTLNSSTIGFCYR